MKRYNPKEIEAKWRKVWQATDIYKTPKDPGDDKFYCLVMFPYPSGNLHVGHWYNFGPADTVARFNRMLGRKVLHPIGYDSFGLPAENAAIKNNIPPAEWTRSNIKSMTKQLEAIGTMYDMDKLVVTSSPEYYRWTQWLFLKLYEKGLAYRREAPVNWCPSCQTVLANEQVVGHDNHCERCGTVVEQKLLKQWYFKITDYAERLLNDAQELDWPERVQTMQRNWIGRSVGAEVDFEIEGHDERLKVFTTRPDTLFGATYMVLAPEHPIVEQIATKSQLRDVKKYIKETEGKTELDRKQDEKEKTGVFTGAYAINPVNKEKIPIWIADYVLMSYGTGAIMAVPAHDQRDFEFAKKYELPITQVVVPIEADTNNPPQKGFRQVRRQTVIVHLKDKSTGKYALLDWHGSLKGISTAIMGGIEDGQTAEQAALSEIKEEAAIGNAKIVHKARLITGAKYCASHKGENRTAIATAFIAEVDNLAEQGDIDKGEQALHKLVWVAEEEVLEHLVPEHQKLVWRLLHRDQAVEGEGEIINSDKYNGMESSEMREAILKDLESEGVATEKVNYKLRDWLISRQRYWGAPIPIIYCDDCGEVPVPPEDLPVKLPENVEFEPTGKSPLHKIDDFVNTTCPKCGGEAQREIDTLDTFVDSSWYYLRYPNTKYEDGPFDPEAIAKWGQVDHYIGGIEHAILHLLYSRFITKVLYDHADLPFEEPFKKLTNQGMILGPDGFKMSKSKGNVVDPDKQVGSYGTDSLRLYLMFMGPYEQGGPYNMTGITGTRRFIDRVWVLVDEFVDDNSEEGADLSDVDLKASTHKTIKKVTEDLQKISFNTAISVLMQQVNHLNTIKADSGYSHREQWQESLEALVLLLAPMAPHVAEEMWQMLGHEESVHLQAWPAWDDELVKEDLVTIVVQVNGKVRANIEMSADVSDEDMVKESLKDEKIQRYLKDGKVVKTITVSGKLINFVVNN